MKFKTAISASILAVALAACGSGDDASKPDDGKTNLPPKPQACVDAGDQCKWDGKEWVISKPNDGDKPSNDEPPVADTSFDYSDIGVTDTLEPEKRGFAFWKKGVQSPLNAKSFKNNPTQSPIIQWSSKKNYDEDLYNFVAITLDDQNKDSKNKPKFMFDKIGEENQKDNQNNLFFGASSHQATDATNPVKLGQSSFDYSGHKLEWNGIPALVNTFMYRNNDGGWSVVYSPKSNVFLNQEEDKDKTFLNGASGQGTGATRLRVYGAHAFLEYDDTNSANVLKPDGTAYSSDEKHYDLSSRSSKPLEHVNMVWYKLSNKGKRAQATTAKDASTPEYANEKYVKGDKPFPTDVEFDALKYTQFGRLTGEGIDPESEKIDGYTDELLKKYEYTPSSLTSVAGNKKAEDWYFARGTEPTPVATLDNYKAAGKEVVYDGLAVMFGINYDPRKPVKQGESGNGQSTNAVKPLDLVSKSTTLLDGKQNFVRLTWDPSTGDVKGSVYGVWTQATYWRANKNNADNTPTLKKGNAAAIKVESGKVVYDDTKEIELNKLKGDTTDNASIYAAQGLLDKFALKIEPYFNQLVKLEGKVVEGTNSFGGKATRVKDGSNGLFHGGFFGKDGSEVGGVINSQTGSFKDENLTDPATKWGGAFGAKNQKSEDPEDLIFEDKSVDYGTSTEFFTNNQ